MEKVRLFLRSLRPWPIFIITLISLAILALTFFASQYLRQSAKLKLGSNSGLVLSADRQDSLGTFSDSTFTLKSDQDLSASGLRDNIAFFPKIDFDIHEITSRQFSLAPKSPLKDNSLYRIQVLSDQKTFSWAFQTKNDFRVIQTLPRDKATYVPLNTGIEITFSHDNWEDVDKYFEITPSVEGRFERHKRTISFIPKSLAPDTLYTVKIKKGLKLQGTTETLKEDFLYRFETQSPSGVQAQLGFSRNLYEFSSAETPAFDIYSSVVGGGDLSVKVYQYPSLQSFSSDFMTKVSIPRWASNSLRLNRLPVSGLNKVLDFQSPIQKQTYTNFFLFPQTLPKGFYLVEVNLNNVYSQALVQITDLSAYLSVSGTKTLVWVNDISSGTPVAGAKINIFGKEQDTGADGVAYFDTPGIMLEGNEGLITVRQGANLLILPAQNNNQYYYNSDYQKTRRQIDKYWSYFYTDRPTYLPHDKVKFWGLLRDRDNLAQKQKFTLEVTRSDYTGWNFTPVVLYTQDLETSDLGTFIGEIPLSSYNPGYYGLTAKIGDTAVFSSSFSVETYTKPAYQLSLVPSARAAIVGETISFSGQATFFEGSPVPGMDLKYNGAKEGHVTTDSLGRFSFSDTPSINSNYVNYFPQYNYFSIMPSLPEEGLISASTSIAVFNASLVFGNFKSESKNNLGRVELDLRQVDTGKFTPYTVINDVFAPASGRLVTGDLMEIQWNRREVGTYYDFINKVTSPRYEYDRVQNKIAEISLITDGSGKAQYEFPLAEGKSYNVVLRATDDQGRVTGQEIYVYGSGENNYQNTSIFLKTDKTGSNTNSYAVGETVNLTVMRGETPIEASSIDKFLYLFAERGLRSYQLADSGQLSFKYPETFIPNVNIRSVRFTGKTYQVSENLNLMFDTTVKKLSLSLTQDKASYLPGDTAKISVLAKDQGGTPASAEVNLSLLDEAYNVSNPSFVDPLARIYSSLDADIIASYQSHQYPLDTAGAEGGGCFLLGTRILLGSGKTKNIEDIKVGDIIKTLQDPLSGKLVTAKVIKTFKHQVAGYLVFNSHLRVTGEHNLYINGRFMTASEVKVGDSYLDSEGNYQTVYSIESLSGLNTVYNFTVEKLNTYFADGFYVHNEKGRELFVDNAFFGSIRTGSDGRGSVEVKLPDNLTSWRITSQGVTGDLKVGLDSSLLVVKQPFFVDAVMNTEYLVGERPQILIRAYGSGLSLGEQVTLSVKGESLGLDKNLTIKAFESAKVDLGELKEGVHKITFSGQSGNLSDKLVRSIKVIKSRLTVVKSVNIPLTLETKPVGSPDSSTRLIFSDLSLGRFYPPLSNLAYTWGDRLDQRLARSLSQEIIQKTFDDSIVPEKLDLTAFQTPDGGYALFPYSGSDLELSSFLAAIAKDKVDAVGLANYFYRQFSEAKDIDTASMSLFGLASLDEPVLLLINNLSEAKEITPLSRIYLALAQVKIGDTEKAIVSYRSILSDYSEKQDSFIFIKVGQDKDSYLQSTALTAALASLLGESEADSLLAYTLTNSGKDILLVSPQLLAISNQLNHSKPQPVSFSYILNGKKTSQKLEKGQVYKLDLSPAGLSEISFQDLSGNIGLTTAFSTPLDPATAEVNQALQLGRSYSVRGKVTNAFSGSDLIKVSLPVSYSEISQDGCYQVSDLLPSGLRPITSVYSFGLDSGNVWYPYEINGQKVSFCIGKGDKNKVINYYARVVSGGDYHAESALIQSLISPSVYNLSPAGTVSIK